VRRKIVLSLTATVSVAACGFVVAVLVHKGLVEASLWAGILAALAAVIATALAVSALPRPLSVPLPPELQVPEWVVDRPAELVAVVKALIGAPAGTVGITTGLYGAGGFGKTTLAQMVCADRRVRRRFGGRVYLVTVGRDVRGAAAVAAKVNDVIKLVAGEDATFTDPLIAGKWLGSLLDVGPRRLLVLDDVWEPEQLAPFTEGGKSTWRQLTALTSHANRVVTVAVTPDGSWLASGSWDKTVRIWSMPGGHGQAMMRLDNSVDSSAWVGTNVLAVGGSAGLYLFDFLTATSSGVGEDEDPMRGVPG
jgi:hypothetical protein